MSETLVILSNALSLSIGIGVGYILSRFEKKASEAVKEVHDLKEIIHVSEDPKGHHKTPWWKRNSQKLKDTGIFLCVLFSFVAAYISGQYAYHSREDQLEAEKERKQLEWITECQQQILDQTLEALKARSIFTEQTVAARLILNQAQQDFLETITDPEASEASQQQAFESYVQTLNEDIRANRETLEVRDTNPFPSDAKLLSCENPPEDPPE
jgi:hypothetical protein